jgi:hypothetical protein
VEALRCGSLVAPARAITEAFTWSTAAIYAGIASGEVASGWLVDPAGAHSAIALTCVSACLAAVLATSLRDRLKNLAEVCGS